jgi:methanogenic corrinoid protein MtbC1
VALGRGWDAGTGRPVVLACAPGELHDIGLVCFGLALWRRGWRIVYLGQTTPVSDMREALSSVGAAALVVHVHSEELLGRSDAQLGELAEDVALALSGGGASPAAAARLGAELLEGDPVEAAIAADRRWQSLRASR